MIGILRPLPITAVAATSNSASAPAVLTRSPREVWTSAAGTAHAIDIDLGSAQSADCIYIGGVSAPGTSLWGLQRATGMGTGLVDVVSGTLALTGAAAAPYESALVINAPVSSRYWRINIATATSVAISVGVVAIGQLFRHPYAYGAGRPLVDTSRRTELFDGGFGVDEGTVKAGFRWRFVDLSEARAEELYALLRQLGTSKPGVVIENLTVTLRDTSLHYGLFDRFEPWERANAIDTVWALSLSEWR